LVVPGSEETLKSVALPPQTSQEVEVTPPKLARRPARRMDKPAEEEAGFSDRRGPKSPRGKAASVGTSRED
jgi:hypothetical protein